MFGKQSYGNEYLRDMKELKEEMENRLITKSSIASRRGVSSIAVLHDRLRRRRRRRYLSVALFVGLRRPGVTWHLALWSPDFPRHPEG